MSENIFIVSVVLKDRQQPVNLYFNTRERAVGVHGHLCTTTENESSVIVRDDFDKEMTILLDQIQAVATVDADLDFAAQEILAMKEARKQARIRNKMGSDPAFRMVKGMPIVGGNN